MSWILGTLAPGQSQTVEYQVIAKMAGRLCNKAVATAAGNFRQEQESCVTVGEAKLAILWDPETGKERLPTTGHVGPIDQLSFRADGRRLFSFGRDSKLIEWDLRTRQALPLPTSLQGRAATCRRTALDLYLLFFSSLNTTPIHKVTRFRFASASVHLSFAG